VRLAKQRFRERHAGQLFCEVCGFDYAARYGELGDGFIEAHHRVPWSELNENTLTRIVDLAMVCANCHRMLHRRTPWLAVDELREIVQGRVA
jgi:putative restriction endonuclease